MKNFLLKLYVKAQILREDHGQDLIEYALIAALIAVACIGAMRPLATAIQNEFNVAAAALTT